MKSELYAFVLKDEEGRVVETIIRSNRIELMRRFWFIDHEDAIRCEVIVRGTIIEVLERP